MQIASRGRQVNVFDDFASGHRTFRVVVSQPPVASVESLGKMRFYVASRVLFPATKISLERTKEEARKLADSIDEAAKKTEAFETFLPEAAWYGIDPIHVRRRFQTDAFSGMMKLWKQPVGGETDVEIRSPLSATNAPRAARKRPTAKVRWVMRREIETAQPCVSDDRLAIHTY